MRKWRRALSQELLCLFQLRAINESLLVSLPDREEEPRSQHADVHGCRRPDCEIGSHEKCPMQIEWGTKKTSRTTHVNRIIYFRYT